MSEQQGKEKKGGREGLLLSDQITHTLPVSLKILHLSQSGSLTLVINTNHIFQEKNFHNLGISRESHYRKNPFIFLKSWLCEFFGSSSPYLSYSACVLVNSLGLVILRQILFVCLRPTIIIFSLVDSPEHSNLLHLRKTCSKFPALSIIFPRWFSLPSAFVVSLTPFLGQFF